MFWLRFSTILPAMLVEGVTKGSVRMDTRSTETEWKAPGFSNDDFFNASVLGDSPSTPVKRLGVRYNTTLPRLNGCITPD